MPRAGFAGLLIGFTLAWPAWAAASETAAVSAERVAQVQRLIAAAMSERSIPGLSVAIGVQGDIAWSAGFGMADLENFVPATPLTRYRTASISKWLTATVALRLMELGKLDLAAPVQKYCKRYPQKEWRLEVRHLLDHTGGVRHYYGENDEPRATLEHRDALDTLQRLERATQYRRFSDSTAVVEAFKNDPLIFEPGTQFRYTSLGYRLLGCVLEGASGRTYIELLHELVLAPSGMVATVADDAWAIVPHRAAGYAVSSLDGGIRRADFRDVSENLAAGGHLSTADDLVRFAMAFDSGKLVGDDSRAAMLRRTAVRTGDKEGSYYGMGVNIGSLEMPAGLPAETMLYHSGSQNGVTTYLLLLPGKSIAVAVMTNKEDAGPGRLARAIAVLLCH